MAIASSWAQPEAPPILQVGGTLESGDAQFEDGSFYDDYAFEAEAGEAVIITLESEAFDTYLLLLNEAGDPIAANDDGEDTTNSQIGIVLPEAGTYHVRANAYSADTQGAYNLTVEVSVADDIRVRRSEAERLNSQGVLLSNQANYPEALNYYQQALAIRQEIRDRNGIGQVLNNIGLVYNNQGNYPQALDYYQQALTIRRDMGDRRGEGITLNNIGSVYNNQSDYPQALDYYQQALAIQQEIRDRSSEATILNNIGSIYNSQGDYPQALDYYQQSLVIRREVGDRRGEGITLNNIGLIYNNQANYAQALDYYQPALAIYRDIGDRSSEAGVLNNIGGIYDNQGSYSQALDYYQQALIIQQEVGDLNGQETTLSNIGGIYDSQGDYPQALDYYQQSLAIVRELRDRNSEGITLNNIGFIYNRQGDYPQALNYYQQALVITRELRDRSSEAIALNNIGFIYDNQDDDLQALDYYQQSLNIRREIRDRKGEGVVLLNIGGIYDSQGDYPQALDNYQQALTIQQEIRDRSGEGTTLNNIGIVYKNQENYPQALKYFQRALGIFQDIGELELEAQLLANIGVWFVKQDQPTPAIIFLKQAVNVYETIRTNNQDFESQELQQSYTDTVANNHRVLAKLLLEQGRIPEAQQVLDLLQLEELREFTDTRAVWTSDGIRLSEPEQTVIDAHGSLIALGSKVTECERVNCANLDTLYTQQESLLAQYDAEVARFVETIRTNRRDDDIFQNPDNISGDAQGLLEAYAAEDQNTLLVYPFVLEDKLWLVWVTVGDVVGSVEVPVSQGELATTVQQFGTLLNSRSSDIDELQVTSQKLYSWIIEPIATELEQNNIDHLVFVNDRVTRYIPMGALYDGENYLLERYTVSTVLAPGATDMSDRLDSVTSSNVLGLGLTEAVENFSPLPAVRDELAGIIKDQDGDGIYPGQAFLNQDFTFDAFKNNVQGNRILHVATHAAFEPGRPEESFIVLGDGNRMKIPDIETMQRRLRNLHLVVLSACQTALGGTNQEDGTEITGLSSYFLEANRAEAVVASLWSVNDGSTSVLMQRFYENMAAGDTKADALRKAQLSLLDSDQTADGDARIIAQRQAEDLAAAPLSHPYFWAPFILIGNGL